MLIGLLVTAGLIPQTFEAGAIDLLLSKPVNRSLTFLTKFVGGCIFVGLAAAYLARRPLADRAVCGWACGTAGWWPRRRFWSCSSR